MSLKDSPYALTVDIQSEHPNSNARFRATGTAGSCTGASSSPDSIMSITSVSSVTGALFSSLCARLPFRPPRRLVGVSRLAIRIGPASVCHSLAGSGLWYCAGMAAQMESCRSSGCRTSDASRIHRAISSNARSTRGMNNVRRTKTRRAGSCSLSSGCLATHRSPPSSGMMGTGKRSESSPPLDVMWSFVAATHSVLPARASADGSPPACTRGAEAFSAEGPRCN
eukprot:scaffold174224_cov29-Tisochrysis_lutea.AAC.4